MVYVFLSHDVDWPLKGPGIRHILERRERFSDEIIRRVLTEKYNPYFNIPEIMSIEEKFGVRSTFFFRPFYDDYSTVDCYADVIKELIRGGWEVGVHLNSVSTVTEVAKEVKAIERIANVKVLGSRVHYLRINVKDYWKLWKAGVFYDSSLKYLKHTISVRDMDYKIISNVIVFPITIMDAYLFTYMGISEDKVVKVVKKALNKAFKHGRKIVTILWHDSSLKMKGGRMYGDIVETLSSMDNINILRGVDLAHKVVEGQI